MNPACLVIILLFSVPANSASIACPQDYTMQSGSNLDEARAPDSLTAISVPAARSGAEMLPRQADTGKPHQEFSVGLHGADSLIRDVEITLKRAKIRKQLRIISEPFGAGVYEGDSLLGSTPIFFDEPSWAVCLKFKLEGFHDTALAVGQGSQPPAVFLRPINFNGEKTGSFFLDPEDDDELLPVYVAGGTAIISGAAAAYFKIRADRLHSQYKSTIDQEKLATIRRFDKISAVSLIVSQVSVAVLSYLLLSR